jgi:hypothetical protein
VPAHVIFNQHDIPPPISIAEGSLTIESDYTLTRTADGGRWRYRKTTGPTDIGHIRILKGNGTMVHENLTRAEGSRITVELDNDGNGTVTGNIIITCGRVFEIDSSTDLGQPVDQGAHGQSKKRRQFRLNHPGPQAGQPFRITGIEITNQIGTSRIDARNHDAGRHFFSEEFRILLWLH